MVKTVNFSYPWNEFFALPLYWNGWFLLSQMHPFSMLLQFVFSLELFAAFVAQKFSLVRMPM